MGLRFFVNSILLGVGLAMDAFSVSLANGLNEPQMKKGKMASVAGIFAGFQFLMPLLGWICVSKVAETFEAFQKWIPWIALFLLGYIGVELLRDGIRCKRCEGEEPAVGLKALLIQGLATSIDALSVGFTIADYGYFQAIVACMIIGAVTFFICFAGISIGKKAGTRLAGKAGILGGLILIGIGIEIFLEGIG